MVYVGFTSVNGDSSLTCKNGFSQQICPCMGAFLVCFLLRLILSIEPWNRCSMFDETSYVVKKQK